MVKQYYKNDLKYKKHRNLTDKEVSDIKNKLGISIEDMDTIEYRIKDMLKSGGTTLDISHLDLTNLPQNIPTTVQHLFCSNNTLTSISSLKYLKNLLVFDCCCNKLTKLPELPESVVEINCRNNNIKNTVNLQNYQYLRRLDISYNDLETLLINSSIEILVCGNNRLTDISSNNISNLKKLVCNNNNLKKIQEYPNLEILICHKNSLVNIMNYSKLLELHCSGNQLESISNLSKIKFIDCHANSKLDRLEYFETLKELICDYHNMKVSKKYNIKQSVAKEDKNVALMILIPQDSDPPFR